MWIPPSSLVSDLLGVLDAYSSKKVNVPSIPFSTTPSQWRVLVYLECLVQFMGLIQLPLLLFFSCASAAFGGYALPKFSQLTMTSYYASSSASHYGISLFTRHIEDAHISKNQQEKLR